MPGNDVKVREEQDEGRACSINRAPLLTLHR
jgi:hypothetical protein